MVDGAILSMFKPKSVLRKGARLVDEALRIATAGTRVLPDFVIVGAQKAGTTSLYSYIGQNKCVIPLNHKEIHYFDNYLSRGQRWYRSRFCRASDKVELSTRTGKASMTGEATPFYMFHPEAMGRMRSVVPGAKILVLLREPAARAYSHYHHERRKGVETLGFSEAIKAEPERLRRELDERGPAAFDDPRSMQRHASYVSRGHYAAQLIRVYEHFPRDQVMVLLSDDLFADPQRVYDRTCEFLGLPLGPLASVAAVNQGGYAGASASELSELQVRFSRWNAELADLGVEARWRS